MDKQSKQRKLIFSLLVLLIAILGFWQFIHLGRSVQAQGGLGPGDPPGGTGTACDITITGSVRDELGRPLANAWVQFGNDSDSVFTDDQGNYFFTNQDLLTEMDQPTTRLIVVYDENAAWHDLVDETQKFASITCGQNLIDIQVYSQSTEY